MALWGGRERSRNAGGCGAECTRRERLGICTPSISVQHAMIVWSALLPFTSFIPKKGNPPSEQKPVPCQQKLARLTRRGFRSSMRTYLSPHLETKQKSDASKPDGSVLLQCSGPPACLSPHLHFSCVVPRAAEWFVLGIVAYSMTHMCVGFKRRRDWKSIGSR
jgi:hypothetical protein